MPPTDADSPQLVTAAGPLGDLVELARAAGRFGLDTEFIREKTYYPRLCLAQLAAGGRVFLVDPTQGLDLRPVGDLLTDPAVEVVVHAGRQDLELFFERYGTVPTNVFDIQLAAGFAGHGASQPYGRLIDVLLGVALEKGEAYSDWCRRPLTPAQLQYAANDVRYLLAAADSLNQRLEQLGRTAWVREELRSLEERATYARTDDDAWRKVAGGGVLSGRQLAVLREVARWREDAAARRDLPRGWLVKDPTLIEIARRGPSTVGSLKDIRGLDPREAERAAPSLLPAIARGLAAEPIHLPRPPSRADQARARMLAGLADAVLRARCDAAGVATELVATRSELEAVIVGTGNGAEPANHRLLQGWRRSLAGEAVLDLLRGRLAIRAIDQPPYLAELRMQNAEGTEPPRV
ncbi:MAG: ribonuclease D [Chloroflexota bacterium]